MHNISKGFIQRNEFYLKVSLILILGLKFTLYYCSMYFESMEIAECKLDLSEDDQLYLLEGDLKQYKPVMYNEVMKQGDFGKK